MNIIIPMAGLGQRFSKSGFSLPKPLIKVGSKPMYSHALDSLPLHMASQLIFIVRRDKFLNDLTENIKEYYSKYLSKIVILENETEGQAETVLKSASEIDYSKPTLIHNCDTYFHSSILWESIVESNIDAAMVLFPSQEKRWSYAVLNRNQTKITDVREKEVISPFASTGTYYFQDSKLLMQNIQTLIDLDLRENNEFYLSGVYRLMLEKHKSIAPLFSDKILCFGTPEDLVNSLNELLCDSL